MPHVDPDRLTLLALGEGEPDPADADHLATCGRCRSDLEATREVVTLAREADDLRDLPAPSPALWDRIAAEAFPDAEALPDAGAPGAEAPPVPRPRHGPGGASGRWRTAWIATAALIAGILGTAGVVRLLPDGDRGTRVVASAELLPQAGAPSTARGRAQVVDTGNGLQVVVTVEGMPATSGYYTVWIYDGRTVMIPLGSPGSAPLNLPEAARDLDLFRVVDVSAQALGQQEHGRSMLQGTLR